MSKEQQEDIVFWRKAEKRFLRYLTIDIFDVGSGLCRYINANTITPTAIKSYQRRFKHLQFFHSTEDYWFPRTLKNLPLRALFCGLIAAMIETNDL